MLPESLTENQYEASKLNGSPYSKTLIIQIFNQFDWGKKQSTVDNTFIKNYLTLP